MIYKNPPRYRSFSVNSLFAIALTFFVLLPIIFIFIKATNLDLTIIKQWINSGLLWTYIYNTIALMLAVAAGCAILGTATAWIVVYCKFPNRKWIEFAILLPFIMPPWIAAWSWKELLDYGGIWHNSLKWLENIGYNIKPNDWLIPIDNLFGASFIMSFSFYPYIYLLCRTSFLQQSSNLFEASRLMNCSKFEFFYRVSLPMIRPALAAGVLVVMMEVLNDFGTVRYFSIPVLMLAIEDAWVYRASAETAAAISILTLIIALVLLSLEHASRKKTEQFAQTASYENKKNYELNKWQTFLAITFLLLPTTIGFFIPLIYILNSAVKRVLNPYDWEQLIKATLTSFSLASITAVITTLFAFILIWSSNCANNHSHKKSKISYFLSRTASLGYAVPGMILGTGILVFASFLDKFVEILSFDNFHFVFVGSALFLVYGWMVRFLSLAIGNIDSGFSRINPNIANAAHSLGLGKLTVLRRIYFPLLSKFMITSIILVFIDSIKELPMAFLIRPFNMELLSLQVWQYGSMEQLEDAAPGAIILILLGIIPLLFIWSKFSKK